jgi:uncharacterized protein (DUF433 family)
MEQLQPNIYGGKDPGDVAAYSVAEAAKYLKIPPTTLRPWVIGRQYPRRRTPYFSPLILTPEKNLSLLSFNNLVEAYVLRALRIKHKVSMEAVREAIKYAQERYQIERLLLSPELRTAAGAVFIEHYGKLIQLKKSEQLVIEDIFRAHLERIEWDQIMPVRLYPFPTGSHKDLRREIVIDARRAFGRPIIDRQGISTTTIVDRVDAGESQELIAADYGLTSAEVLEALTYEEAA